MSKIKLNLLNLIECIEKIEIYTKSLSNFKELEKNAITFDATMMMFITLGETIKKLPNEYKKTFPDIPWQDVLDFRNIAAHNYFGLNPKEIWQIITIHLPKFKKQIKVLVEKS